MACLAALAVAGGSFGKGFYDQYQENRAASTADATDSIDQPVARTPEGTPVGGVIDDAQSVVDEINDNPAEAELLGEMGLDPTGAATDAELPPLLNDVLPSFATDALKVSTTQPDGSGRYVYDDVQLAVLSPSERSEWLIRWGLDDQAPPAGDITIEVVILFGQVQLVVIEAPDSAGSMSESYEVTEPDSTDGLD